MKKFWKVLFKFIPVLILTAFFVSISLHSSAYAETTSTQTTTQTVTKNAQVKTVSAGLATKVAPGELLPVSVKLSNFGGGARVDVLVRYEIFASGGKKIFSISETVAVETTNNYVKTLQVPFGAPAGIYTAKTSITYQGQLVPATTEFSFRVEPKILGLFRSEFFLYSGITVTIGALAVVVGYSLVKRHKITRLTPLDYSNIPRDQRIFYELISDTVMGMRQRVGDKALDVAMQTNGLVIDKATGRIVELTDTPSKVIAELVSGYERVLGKKVSFSFRGNSKSKTGVKP